jgi:hypothetical protein
MGKQWETSLVIQVTSCDYSEILEAKTGRSRDHVTAVMAKTSRGISWDSHVLSDNLQDL